MVDDLGLLPSRSPVDIAPLSEMGRRPPVAGTASQSEDRRWPLALRARAGVCSKGTEAEGAGRESGAGKFASEHSWECDVDAEFGANNAQSRVPGPGCAAG